MPLTTNPNESCSATELLKIVKKALETQSFDELLSQSFTQKVIDEAISKLLAEGNVSSPRNPFSRDKMSEIIKAIPLTDLQLNAGLVLELLLERSDCALFCAYLIEKGAKIIFFKVLNTSEQLKSRILAQAFVNKLAKAVSILKPQIRVGDACVYSYIHKDYVPLMTVPMMAGDFTGVQAAFDIGASSAAVGADGYPVSHYLRFLPGKMPVAEIQKFVKLIAIASELNVQVKHRTPLSFAADKQHLNLILALLSVSLELHKPLLPNYDRSIWELTTHSCLPLGSVGEDATMSIVTYAFACKKALPRNESYDVFRSLPKLRSYEQKHPAEFVHRAIEKCWPRVVRCVVKFHPEWLQDADKSPMETAIEVVKRSDCLDKSLLTVWELIRLGSDLTEGGPNSALAQMSHFSRSDLELHLAVVSCWLLANFARSRRYVEAEAKQVAKEKAESKSEDSCFVHAAKKLRVEINGKDEKQEEIKSDPRWLVETRRVKKLFNDYPQHVFFNSISVVVTNLDSACYLICDCLVKFIALKSKHLGSNNWMIPMIFSFLDLADTRFLLSREMEKKEAKPQSHFLEEPKEWKSFSVSPKLHKAFLDFYITELVKKCAKDHIGRFFRQPAKEAPNSSPASSSEAWHYGMSLG